MRFPRRYSSSGSRVIYRCIEQCCNRPNLTFGDLWWPDLWPDLKNDTSSFFMIFDALSNAVYRVSLHGRWAELDGGGVQTPPPGPARSAPSSGPARVKIYLLGRKWYCAVSRWSDNFICSERGWILDVNVCLRWCNYRVTVISFISDFWRN